MIKIIERDGQLDEDTLNRYERQGLVLISVNRGDEKFAGPDDFCCTITPWVYHFRYAYNPKEREKKALKE